VKVFCSGNKILFLLCFLNFLFCLISLIFFSDLFYVPGHEYTDLARNLAAGRGYRSSGFFHLRYFPSAFLTPFYPLFLAFFIKLFDLPFAYAVVRFFQIFLNFGILVMICLIAEELFEKETAIFSALLFAFYLPFIAWTGVISDTLSFALVLLLTVFLVLKVSSKNYWLLGITLGIGMLISATFVIVLLALFLYGTFSGKVSFRHLLWILVIAMLVISPWTIRNALVFKAFIPLRTGLWLNLYLGNNPDATGTVYLKYQGRVPEDFRDGITYHFRPMISQLVNLNEYQQDQVFKKKFFEFIWNNPLNFMVLFFKKIYYYFWFNPFEANNLLWVWEYALVLGLAVWGLINALREKKRVGFILLLFIFFTLTYALTGPFFNWKYRLPIEPYLIILAGHGVAKVLNQIKYLKFKIF
jgi:4-amino-4-deoxy-L-arabinose transferase-like glycosyltransferase